MAFRFSTPFFLGILILGLVSCNGLSTRNHPPLVFALNLSAEPVTIQLEKTGVFVEFADILPGDSRPLVKVVESEAVVLRTVTAGREETWTDPSGTPYALRLQTGHLYAVVVDFLGKAALYSLPETYSEDPKLCVINASETSLSQVHVAPDWGKNIKVYLQDLAPVVPSEFHSIEPKTLGLFWQTMDQRLDNQHTSALDSNGKPLTVSFEKNRYYLFLAGQGSVRDLTPAAD